MREMGRQCTGAWVFRKLYPSISDSLEHGINAAGRLGSRPAAVAAGHRDHSTHSIRVVDGDHLGHHAAHAEAAPGLGEGCGAAVATGRRYGMLCRHVAVSMQGGRTATLPADAPLRRNRALCQLTPARRACEGT